MTTLHDQTTQVASLADVELLSYLPSGVRKLVTASLELQSFAFGDVVVREGEDSDATYVVRSGRLRVLTGGDGGVEVPLSSLGPGDTFGEMGSLHGGARTATVRASSAVEVWRLDGAVLRALARTNKDVAAALARHGRRRALRSLLRRHGPFGDLPEAAKDALLDLVEPFEAAAGTVVVAEGDPPGPMFVVEEGRLRAEGGGIDLAFYRDGDVFGEASLVTDAPRAATVIAVSDVRLLRLTPAAVTSMRAKHAAFDSAVRSLSAAYATAVPARVPLDFAGDVEVGTLAPLPLDSSGDATAPEAAGVVADEVDAGPFTDDLGRFRKGTTRIRRFRHVAQVDAVDCGAACLAMVSRYHGRRISLVRARELARTSIEGSSLGGIVRGGQAMGLAVRSVKASRRNLDQMPLPAVVHWDGNHWVVLYDVEEDRVTFDDPGVGRRRVPRAEFQERWSGYAALFEPTPEFAEAKEDAASVAWFLPFVQSNWHPLAAATGLAILVSLVTMGIPLGAGRIIDAMFQTGQPSADPVTVLNRTLLALVGAVALIMTASFLQRWLLATAAVRIDVETFDHVTGRLLSLPMRYFHARRTGDIQRRLGGLRQIRAFVLSFAQSGLTSIAQLIVALILMTAMNVPLTLVFLATIPLYGIVMRIAVTKLRPMIDTLEDAFGRYSSRQIDAIKGIESVKSLGAEDRLRAGMLDEFTRLTGRQFTADLAVMGYDTITTVISYLLLLGFLWVGAHQVLPDPTSGFTIGSFVAFNTLLGLASGPVLTLIFMFDDLQLVTVLVERLNDVFVEQPEQADRAGTLLPVPTLAGAVSFDEVSFSYDGPDGMPIVDRVSFEVPPGQTVAIVGRSGSGKSTLVKLLAGLIEPTGGRILFDGLDAHGLDVRQLRHNLGFVLQESYLFSETIAANIAFGVEHPDMDRVERAARIANAHGFIAGFPLGYDTKVGETGIQLSGGQRQRINIARALYGDPAVLLLDEATSSLDAESERAVQDNLDRVLRGRTSFIIAHRLSTIRDADTILVLDKGRVVERGSHDELLARQGLYYYLAGQQLGL